MTQMRTRSYTTKRYAEDTHKKKIDYKQKIEKQWTPTTEEEDHTHEVAVDETEASEEEEDGSVEELVPSPRIKKEN